MPWFEISVACAAALVSLYPQRFLAIVGARTANAPERTL